MSANLMELTRSTSPGSPATPNGVTVEAAEAPAAPQVLDAAAAAAASRLTPAPTTAALATHLRRVLGVGDGTAVAPAAARPVVVSPRDMAAKVRDIMSPRGGESGGAGAGGGSSTGKSTGKSGKSPVPSRKRPRSPSPPSSPVRSVVRRPSAHQSPGDRSFAARLAGPERATAADFVGQVDGAGDEAPAVFPCPAKIFPRPAGAALGD